MYFELQLPKAEFSQCWFKQRGVSHDYSCNLERVANLTY